MLSCREKKDEGFSFPLKAGTAQFRSGDAGEAPFPVTKWERSWWGHGNEQTNTLSRRRLLVEDCGAEQI